MTIYGAVIVCLMKIKGQKEEIEIEGIYFHILIKFQDKILWEDGYVNVWFYREFRTVWIALCIVYYCFICYIILLFMSWWIIKETEQKRHVSLDKYYNKYYKFHLACLMKIILSWNFNLFR